MTHDPLTEDIHQDIQKGHALLLRGLADMMRTASSDPMFPTPQFTTDTSAKGISQAWADHLDGAADQIDPEATR